ncbi:MAG: hypothetical protein ACKO90_26225, partial [Microcystis panniformis]
IDEVDGQTRQIIACQVAQQVDLILFIISGDMTKVEFSALAKLREAGKPMILVFNKIDQYPEVDRLAIYEKIASERVKELLSPDEIVMVAASPLVAETVKGQDGRLKTQRFRGKPQIEALKLKILEILEREGKSLVALNSMLYADEVNEQISYLYSYSYLYLYLYLYLYFYFYFYFYVYFYFYFYFYFYLYFYF